MLQSKTAAALRPFRLPGRKPCLLVALPALDEERTIKEVITRIPRLIPGLRSVDILVIDDGSTDATCELARQAGATVLIHSENRGVGAALHSALAYAVDKGYDLVATIDSDGQFSPEDIPQLVAPVVAGDVHFTTASRFKDPHLVPAMRRANRWGNYGMSLLISLLAGKRIYDVSCGMRCYSREASLQLQLLGAFTYTQEAILSLVYKGFRVQEVPIAVQGERSYGKSRVASSLWQYGMRSVGIILRCARDYRPLHVFGTIALFCGLIAISFGSFLGLHYFESGALTPHKWAGALAILSFVLAAVSLQAAIFGDLLTRQRTYLEEVIYLLRRDQAD